MIQRNPIVKNSVFSRKSSTTFKGNIDRNKQTKHVIKSIKLFEKDFDYA